MMRGTLSGMVGSGRAFAAAALMAAAVQSVGFAQTPARPESQTQSGQAQSQSGQTRSEGEADADLSITARVTAESLRFEKVPNPRVEFTGRPRRETLWKSDRENLPQEVRPGVTYRDIGITLRITSVFADIDRIVAEALGEVPLSDDARPATTPQPPATNTPPPAANTPQPATSTTPSEPTTPPTQSPTSAAATQQRRRAPARRGRVN